MEMGAGNSSSKSPFQKYYWDREGLNKRRSPRHPVVQAYVLDKIETLKPYLPLYPPTRLLDVGCGNGFFTYHFENLVDTTGVDYSEKLISMNPYLQAGDFYVRFFKIFRKFVHCFPRKNLFF